MTDFAKEALFGLCRKVDTPKSLGVWLRFEHAQDELARVTIAPEAYNDADAFFRDYACVNFLRKYEGLTTGVDTREVSLQAFDKAEEQCRLTNQRFLSYATTGHVDRVEPEIFSRAQQLIAKVWNSPTSADLFRRCAWGPGSTATLSGARSTTEGKMSELPLSVTPSALPYLRMVMKDDYAWMGHLLRCKLEGPACLMPELYGQIDHSRLLTVPKDAKTDRVIAAEPTGNIFLQLGVGNYLKARLRKFGVNLEDQTRNQELAQKANSLKLATLDLSAASDTISIGLCKALLPPDMFSILDCLRSPAFKVGAEVRRFHKFSSMGNGFTFQLESLVFWALAKSVQDMRGCQGPIGVYGDDIIVPQPISSEVVTTLESWGFTINEQKSFVNGRFFESCGKHYFDGVDVTPIYQKHVVDHDLEISRLFNRVFDLAYARPYLDADRCFGKVHSRLLSLLPKRLKQFYAPGWVEGDGFFRCLSFHGRFSLARGYQINFMEARKPRQKIADGGLYSYMLRKRHETPVPDLLRSKLENLGTKGEVSIRPGSRVKTFRVAKRWIPLSSRKWWPQ